jgi:proline racemase
VPVPKNAPSVEVVIDTAVGVVRTTAHMDGPKVRSVTVGQRAGLCSRARLSPRRTRNRDHPGGHCVRRTVLRPNRCPQLWTRSRPPARGKELARAGAMIKLAALDQIWVNHPINPEISGVN